jgi:hypothetical protein
MSINIQPETVKEGNKLDRKKPSIIKIIHSPLQEINLINENPFVLKPLVIVSLLQMMLVGVFGYISTENSLIEPILEEIPTSSERLKIIISLLGGVFSVFNMLFIALLTAIIFKICTIIFQKDVPFKKIFSLMIYSSAIPILGTSINLVISIITGSTFKSYTNFSFLFKEDSLIYTTFTSIDLFFIWRFILIGIGLYVIAKLSKKQAILLMSTLFILNLGLGIAVQILS